MGVRRLRKGLRWGCILSIAMLVGAVLAHAQAVTGSISGTVRDQSGAVVPGAQVTLTSLDTGLSISRTTSSDGSYVFTPIAIGNYEVVAKDKGFKTVVHTNIRVEIQQHVVVDFALVPGMVTQTVEVTAAPSLLQTRGGSLGQVVGSRSINALPLNGRNFTFLAQLTAGAIPNKIAGNAASGTTTGSFIVNGMRFEQNNYMLDGLDDNNRMSAYGQELPQAYVALPPVDAINEFNLQTNAYSAEFGRAAGAVMNATTKSGTNQLHGDLWEFVRNDKFDAADFFQNAAGIKKGKFRQNQFGGTIGGPVIIPHLYNGRNKTFFFFDYQGQRIRQSVPLITSVPTLAEVNSGYTNFSDLITGQGGKLYGPDGLGRKFPIGTILDPATTRGPFLAGQVDPVTGMTFTSACTVGNPCYVRDPFPGNIIPANRIFPGAAKILAMDPRPNLPGLFNNYAANLPLTLNVDQYDIRVDQNFSARDQFFARYSHAHTSGLFPATFLGNVNNNQSALVDMHSAVAGWTHTMSPTLVNEALVGYSRLHSDTLQSYALVQGIPDKLGIPGIPQGNQNGGLGALIVGGMSWLGQGTYTPGNEFSETTQASDNVTKIAGKHTLKFGFEYMHMAWPFVIPPASRGRWNFDGSYTSIPGVGDGSTGRAQFLLQPIPATVPDGVNYVGGASGLVATNIAPAALSQNYYGLYLQDDWKVTRKLTLNLGIRDEYYPSYQDRFGAMANLVPNLNWQGGQFLIPTRRANTPLSPSFQAALANDGIKLVASNNPALVKFPSTNWEPRFGFAYEVTPKFVARGGFGIFSGGDESQGGSPNLSNNYPFLFTLVYNAPNSVSPLEPNASVGALSNGFLNVGLTPANVTVNAISPRGIQSPYQTPTMYSGNLTLQYQLAKNDAISVGYVTSLGRHLDSTLGGNLPSVLLPPNTNPQPYVPFPDLSRGYTYVTTQANSYYHALQVNYQHRFDSGLDFLANYAYSNCRDDGGGTLYGESERGYRAAYIPGLGIQYDYGECDWNTTNIFHFSGIWQLPIGRGKRFLRNMGGAENAVLGGWQTNWILSLMSGEPTTIHCAVATNTSDCFALLVPGENKDANQSIAHWWNAAAFADPAPATAVGQTNYAPLGGAPTQVYGPGFHRLDFSLFKEIRTSERTHLELRAEFFNLTNTPNFGMPGATNFLNAKNFGQITSTVDAPNDAREIQLALKLYF
jgi:hypothetical protein